MTQATNAGSGATTGAIQVDTNVAHSVGEVAAAGTSLSNYTSQISCTRNGGTGPSGAGTLLSGITVSASDVLVCTITNTRVGQATIELKKALSPTTDPGRFDLQVNGTTRTTNAGNGATTGAIQVPVTGTHSVGELAASTATSLANYDSQISCTRNGGPGPSGAGTSLTGITVAANDVVVCTITNTRKTGTIEVNKVLSPTTDPGRFDLQIGGTTRTANVGNGGTTNAVTLPTGTYSVGELGNGTTSLAAYTTQIACTVNGSPGPSGSSTTLSGIALAAGDVVVCTITNTVRPITDTATIELKKALSPTTDPGRFDLQVNGTTRTTNAGNGATTGAIQVPVTGTHSVGELAASTATSLANYDSQISCTRNGGPGPSGAGTSLTGITVAANDVVVCTITNTRKTGTIEVNKVLSPTTDPGRFDLQIGGTTRTANVGNGGTTNAVTLPTGTYSVGELGNGTTSLAAYTTQIACTVNGSPGPSGSSTTLSGIALAAGDVVVCTITNTVRPITDTATIELKKALSPTTDPGRFDLQVNGTTRTTNAGNGATTGAIQVPVTGTHSVGELAASTATSLANYDSQISCTRNGGPGPSGAGTSLTGITVAANDVVVCTITNTRKTGTIEVNKVLSPTTDPGRFDLQIGGTTRTANVGNGGTTNAVTLPTGTYSVGELGNGTTSLAAYTTQIACTVNGSPGPSGSSTTLSGIALAAGDVVVCTITNTVRPITDTATIELKKALSPTTDPGRFDLQVNGTTRTTNAGNGATTGAIQVPVTGTHSVGELAASTATSLANYDSQISCTRNGGPGPSGAGTSLTGITVAANDVVVCTITNTRKTGTIEVNKVLSPTTDPGRFDLQIGGTTRTANVGNGGTTNAVTLPTGTYSVGELGNGTTSLSNYTSSIECRNGTTIVATATNAGPLDVPLAAGANVVCTIRNVRKTNGNPPDCSNVKASPALLWPPNHKFRLVTLSGATDPDGGPLTYTITGVTQDEAVGRHPDARRTVAANQIELRAERHGWRDGRVYRIAFTVTDSTGLRCSGVVKVGVPHDRGRGSTPRDSGYAFDSFAAWQWDREDDKGKGNNGNGKDK